MNNFYINKKVNPKGLKKDEYDVIIIGAGIGGLTCGCYLAKAGLKVLIVEQHHKAGGYCTSFKRKGFTFDAGVFALGDCSDKGNLGKIINELRLKRFVNLLRLNPSDVIITTNHKITINTDLNLIISEFQNNFPAESNQIENFFIFLKNSSFANLFVQLHNFTLINLLDEYFVDQNLKTIFCHFISHFGEPPKNASAISSAVIFKQFMLDGGYYPEGGMQSFADALVKVFLDDGGSIIFSCLTNKLLLKHNEIKGIILENDTIIKSKFVVSNSDAIQTFMKLVGRENLCSSFISKITRMVPSISAFTVFLGLKRKIENMLDHKCKYWYTANYSADDVLAGLNHGDTDKIGKHLILSFPSLYDSNLAPMNCESICLLSSAPYLNKEYWEMNKDNISEGIIREAEKIIPDISGDIVVKEIATPHTYHKFTLNNRGAAYGWSCIPSQVTKDVLKQESPIKGLFLAGHWTAQGFGISRVALSGYNAAALIKLAL